MGRKALSALLIVTAAIAIVASAQAKSAKSAGLVGETGPGFKIEVERNGKDLKTMKAGTYRIKIEDKSSLHNFHLIGPGLNKKTSVSFKGETSWMIKLKPGKYTYQCDPHTAAGMKGTFRVTRS
jgi:plastocyanin